MEYKIKCPLCGVDAPYRKGKETHVWVCLDCPFIGFEYYDDTDLDGVEEAIKEGN